ncbi:MAG TPA: aminopeptidase P N-terminal domain-containing protein, partial [Opitutus sp.]|nr:aminopeptidase P N-terminal domain-containing protein [Opitutus sp.]
MSDMLQKRRTRVADALELGDALLLVGAGEPIPLPEGTDQTYPFRAHAEYFYLAGQECPGGIVAFDPREGSRDGWVSFVPDISEGERVWEGREQPPGASVSTLEPWLAQRRSRPIVVLGAALRGVRSHEALTHA